MATKRELVQEIFFEATRGMRTLENFVAGQILMDELAAHNSKSYIESNWKDMYYGNKSPRKVLRDLVDWAVRNTYNANLKATPKSKMIHNTYYSNFYSFAI